MKWMLAVLVLLLGAGVVYHLRERAILEHQLSLATQEIQALQKGNQRLRGQIKTHIGTIQELKKDLHLLKTSDLAQYQRAMKILQSGKEDMGLQSLRNFMQQNPHSKFRASAEKQVQQIEARRQQERQIRLQKEQAQKRQAAEKARRAALQKQGFEVVGTKTGWFKSSNQHFPQVKLTLKQVGDALPAPVTLKASFVLEATGEQLGTAEITVKPSGIQEILLQSSTGMVLEANPEANPAPKLPRILVEVSSEAGGQSSDLGNHVVRQIVLP